MLRCFVGLGANLGDPLGQLREAAQGLHSHPDLHAVALSPVYRSAPMGPPDQPDYLNAVARLDTILDAESLLDLLQELERSAGRVRDRHWGPRTLDLDLLLYGNHRISSSRLRVPHPGLKERDFVLVPLRDIAGADFVLPCGEHLDRALTHCADSDLQRVAAPDRLLAIDVEYRQREP